MKFSFASILLFSLLSCQSSSKNNNTMNENIPAEENKTADTEVIMLGGGCFWCMEAVFQRMKGIEKVESGYSGGQIKNPSYREVCNGTTGHAEVIKVTYDKNKTSLEEILAVFFVVHDPTTLNRQGADAGTQYRSAIYFYTEDQKKTIEDAIAKLVSEHVFIDPIVTEVKKAETFYKAEDYHQDYYNQNSNQSYCRFVVKEKVDKFEKLFKEKMK